MNHNKQLAFDNFKESIFKIDYDISLWNDFLKSTIKFNLNKEDCEIRTAQFTVYDIPIIFTDGVLKTDEKIIRTKISDLELKREEFFNWIMNLSVLNAYNAMEILLLQGIQLKYYPFLENPIKGKSQSEEIQRRIKDQLKSKTKRISTKNNSHLIEFLKINSLEVDKFLKIKVRSDIDSNWYNFFNLVSIIRNIIAHSSMVVQTDIQNELKSKTRDLFNIHFSIKKNHLGLPVLKPDSKNFNLLINMISTFTVNIYKFILEEDDLNFIKLKKVDYDSFIK